MDINNINNIAHAWASHERNEANRGKNVNQKGWVTKDQMRRDAAQKAIGIMIAVAVLTALATLFIKIFGKTMGAIMMVVLALGLPVCFFIQDNMGYNVKWIPLWIVGFALLLKMFTKMFGKKWGLRIGVPIASLIVLIAYFAPEKQGMNTARKSMSATKVTTTTPETPRIDNQQNHLQKVTAPLSVNKNKDEEKGDDDDDVAVNTALNELMRRIETNTDPSSGKLRVLKMRRLFSRLRNGSDASVAYNECLERAQANGWIANEGNTPSVQTNNKNAYRQGVQNTTGNKSVHAVEVAENSATEAAQYAKDISVKLENLLAQVRANKNPNTSEYELDSRVEYLRNMYEQELRCTPYNHNSLADTKAITDKAYRLISSHAYRMHWIESDEEKSIEQSATAYLNCVSAKLEDLIAQVRANRNAMTPSYELDSRAKYLKDMFDREMRFPLRDRWDSVDKAKTHTDNAYKKCLNHAKRMNWIKGE